MIFSHEKLRDIWDEVLPLAHAHWLESEEYRYYQDPSCFRPSRARYQQSEDNGIYFHFCARDADRLVGSAGIYITPSMHTQRLLAMEDTYYLLPEYRGRGRSALRFLQFTERFAQARGAEQFLLTTALTNTRSERVVAHLGYRQVTKGWVKDMPVAFKLQVA